MQIVIDIPRKTYEHIRADGGHGIFNIQDEDNHIVTKAVFDGIRLPEHHGFIAICDNDYPLSEEMIDDLKSTAFMGDIDDSGKVTYCFTIEEIIEGSDSE